MVRGVSNTVRVLKVHTQAGWLTFSETAAAAVAALCPPGHLRELEGAEVSATQLHVSTTHAEAKVSHVELVQCGACNIRETLQVSTTHALKHMCNSINRDRRWPIALYSVIQCYTFFKI
eukprot:1140429-Pelagomonas_calceolata.AAC.5